MKHPYERLQQARIEAGYASAAEAARAMGIAPTSYVNHENGYRPLTRSAERYARFFRVSLDWLVTGRGNMRGAPRIPLYGAVGAGARVDSWHPAGQGQADDIDLPDLAHAGALRVSGDSQWPKWLEGDIVLFDTRPLSPRETVNSYCVVETLAGDRLLKMLRKSQKPGIWLLESHNAAPEEAELVVTYRYLLTLAR